MFEVCEPKTWLDVVYLVDQATYVPVIPNLAQSEHSQVRLVCAQPARGSNAGWPLEYQAPSALEPWACSTPLDMAGLPGQPMNRAMWGTAASVPDYFESWDGMLTPTSTPTHLPTGTLTATPTPTNTFTPTPTALPTASPAPLTHARYLPVIRR